MVLHFSSCCNDPTFLPRTFFKILIYIICFLIVISICIVGSRRQRFVKSKRPRPRGQRHHIFKKVKPSKTSNDRKTTQVTKIVTISDDGKEIADKFNHHDNQIRNSWNSNSQNHQSVTHAQNHKDVKKYSNHDQTISDFNFQIKHHPPNPYFTNPEGSY